MKVGYAPSVPIGDQTLRYNRPADYSALESGVNKISSALEGIGANYQEQQQRMEHFQALSDFSDYETKLQTDLEQAQRDYLPSQGPFLPHAQQIIRQNQEEYLKKVPPRLQPQFMERAKVAGNDYQLRSLQFQYNSNDQYAKSTVTDFLDKAKEGVQSHPDSLETWKGRVSEQIDATPWSAVDKESAKKMAASELEGIGAYDVATQQALTPTPGGSASDYESRVIQLESGGKGLAAYNESSGAFGPYQFIPSTAARYGINRNSSLADQRDAFLKLTYTNKSILSKALGRTPTPGELYLAHQQGPGGALKLLEHPDTLATSIVGKAAVLQNGGAADMTAQQFANLWIDKFQKSSPGDLKSDPRFANVTFEQWQKIDAGVSQDLRGQLESTMPDIFNTVARTGGYPGNEPTQNTFEKAYTGQGEERYQQYLDSRKTAEQMFSMQQMPEADIAKMLQEKQAAIPSGPGAASAQKEYDSLREAATKIMDARKNGADYVAQNFPKITQAWAAWNPNDPSTAQEAIHLSLDTQKQLGIPSYARQPLPSAVVERVAAALKEPNRPIEQQADIITQTILMTKDPLAQGLMIKQLQDKGAPKALEAVVEAAGRGDQEAARRLYAAAVTPPEKYPVALDDTQKKQITTDLEAELFATGSRGHAIYGLMYGQPENAARAAQDMGLMQNLVRINMNKGMSQADAVKSATNDLFGDVVQIGGAQVLPSGQGGFDLVVPTQTAQAMGGGFGRWLQSMDRPGGISHLLTPDAPLVHGFDLTINDVRRTLQANSQALVDQLKLDPQKAQPELQKQARHIESVLTNGVFRIYGQNTVGFYDTLTGTFVGDADGNALQWDLPSIIAKGSAPEPTVRGRSEPPVSNGPQLGTLSSLKPIQLPSAQANLSAYTEQERHLVEHHQQMMTSGKAVHNADGSTSTVLQRVVEHDGKFYSIPSVYDGKIVRGEENVIKAALEEGKAHGSADGWSYWPSYDTPDQADNRYLKPLKKGGKSLHDIMEQDIPN
jgi:hypothetical protein